MYYLVIKVSQFLPTTYVRLLVKKQPPVHFEDHFPFLLISFLYTFILITEEVYYLQLSLHTMIKAGSRENVSSVPKIGIT